MSGDNTDSIRALTSRIFRTQDDDDDRLTLDPDEKRTEQFEHLRTRVREMFSADD